MIATYSKRFLLLFRFCHFYELVCERDHELGKYSMSDCRQVKLYAEMQALKTAGNLQVSHWYNVDLVESRMEIVPVHVKVDRNVPLIVVQ